LIGEAEADPLRWVEPFARQSPRSTRTHGRRDPSNRLKRRATFGRSSHGWLGCYLSDVGKIHSHLVHGVHSWL